MPETATVVNKEVVFMNHQIQLSWIIFIQIFYNYAISVHLLRYCTVYGLGNMQVCIRTNHS